MADPGFPRHRVGLLISYTPTFRFCSRMDDTEELVTGYFHLMRSQHRKKRREPTPAEQRLVRRHRDERFIVIRAGVGVGSGRHPDLAARAGGVQRGLHCFLGLRP